MDTNLERKLMWLNIELKAPEHKLCDSDSEKDMQKNLDF